MQRQKEEKFKRINILVKESQHDRINEAGLNTSGLIRGLIDDHFSESKVTLSLSQETAKLYANLISNFGASDRELEPFILKAFDEFLISKRGQIDSLRSNLKGKKK